MALLWRLLREAEEALTPGEPPLLARACPWGVAVGGLAAALAASLYPFPLLLPAAVLGLALGLLSGWRRSLVLPLYAAALFGLVAMILSPAPPLTRAWTVFAATVALRVYAMSASLLAAFHGLGPLGAQRLAARIHPLAHDVTLLFYRVAPQVAGDTLLAAGAQGLLGRGAREALVGATLSAVRRAEMLRESLYLRGAGPGRRSPLPMPCSRVAGLLLAIAGLASLLLPLAPL